MKTMHQDVESQVSRKLLPPGRRGNEKALQQRLKSERVQEELKTMPGWALAGEGKAIDRAREFPSHRLAHAYAGYVADAAAEAGQPAWVTQSGRQLVITLRSKARNGGYGDLTESTLGFARRLG